MKRSHAIKRSPLNQPIRLLHLPILLIMVLMIVVRSTYSFESFVLTSYLLSYWEKWNINWLNQTLHTMYHTLPQHSTYYNFISRSIAAYATEFCIRVVFATDRLDQDWRRHLVVLESQGCFCFDNGNVRRMGMSQVCVPLRLRRWLRMALWRVNSEGTDAHKLPLKGTYLIKRFLHNVS